MAAFMKGAMGKGRSHPMKTETFSQWPMRVWWGARALPGGACSVLSRKAMRRAR